MIKLIQLWIYNLEILIHTTLLVPLKALESILRHSGIYKIFGMLGLLVCLTFQNLIKRYINYMVNIEKDKTNIWALVYKDRLKFPKGFEEYAKMQDEYYKNMEVNNDKK